MSSPDVLPSPVARFGGSIAGVFSDVLGWTRELRTSLEAGTTQPAARLDEQVHRLVSPTLHAGGPGVRRLQTEEDPRAEGFHDFTRLEWWRVPTTSGMPHLTGPYVDYLCTDQLTVTITVPVRVRDVTCGVFGADLSVAAIDRLAEAAWRENPGQVTVLSRSGRVVTSSDPGRMAGALLRPDAVPAHAVHELPGCWGTLSAVLG
jgi:hypothetical protein